MYNQPAMIESRFKDLCRKKAYQEKRNITLKVVAEESGLALSTIQKVSKGDILKLHVITLNTLCGYFKVRSITELVEFSPDPDPPQG